MSKTQRIEDKNHDSVFIMEDMQKHQRNPFPIDCSPFNAIAHSTVPTHRPPISSFVSCIEP